MVYSITATTFVGGLISVFVYGNILLPAVLVVIWLPVFFLGHFLQDLAVDVVADVTGVGDETSGDRQRMHKRQARQ
jgi:hypothetical protein